MLKAAFAFASFIAGAEGFSEAVKNVRGNLGTDKIIHLPFESMTREAANILSDVDDFGNDISGLHMRVAFSQSSALTAAGISHSDVTNDWISELESNFERSTFVCEDTAEACASANEFYESYQRLASLHQRLENIAQNSNGIAFIGSMGSSLEGRDQKLIEIRRGALNAKPTVFYMCGIHAREWLPVHFCTYMAETLVKDNGHPLLDKVNFIIVPVYNPDGYEFSHTNDNLWRKSRQRNPGSNCIGTDLNRNYDVKHCEEGASTNPCSQTYCGKQPWDNVETANQRDYFASLKQQGVSVLVAVDVHAKGLMWMSPYGYTKALPPTGDYERMTYCGQKGADAFEAVDGNKMAVGSIANIIYVVSGGSKDWMYDKEGVVYSWGLEVRGSSFQPPESNIIPSNLENFAGMVAAVECAYAVEFEGESTDNGQGDNSGESCEDMVPSGLQFNSGRSVECEELGEAYCGVYEVVKERCPKTCGLCKIECEDKSPSGLVYTSGRPAPCNEIERYCSSYESVREACPVTCGNCPTDTLAVAGKLESGKLLVMEIERLRLEDEVPAAIYAAMAVAGLGFVGAVAALVAFLRKEKKSQSVPASVPATTTFADEEDKAANMYDL